ncbi:hypothetical protein LCGC14_1709280 [marine sediment metagenome]|uniref:3'-phosphate/5'-hydroxy nucleic acid ligase n=1 Tax=marine sediment metagenome TaxID=412755 RepID=A0A0F9KFS7_9ZZZZ
MNVISSERIPIKMWLDDLDEQALQQAMNLANLPFAFKHIAIMPDSHPGYGMPIGSILATQGAIIPNAVGVDIGCGMCSVRTNLTDITKVNIKTIVNLIQKRIPVGFNWHKEPQKEFLHYLIGDNNLSIVSNKSIIERARCQLGTLGGGNHFIELQKGDDGYVWIMIHSGSRNLGHTVATHYNKLAVSLNQKWYSSTPTSHELAFLPVGTDEYKKYLKEMNYCIEFALANRELMMERVKESILDTIPGTEFPLFVNQPHNFAAWENHFGKNVIVHRKGACRARVGELGMIPGSQGSKSYIVTGTGKVESFKSCSHGAGRKLGRREAKRKLDLKEEIKKLDKIGVLHNMTKEKLDESPGAYKDIKTVMENQKDLVKIEVELTPLMVIKG